MLAWNTVRSRIGRAFVAMRDNEIAAEALGVDLLRHKIMAFALSGFYAGVAGGLYCGLLNYVAPEGFDLFQMVIHKAMVVVGGVGSVVGSVIGATLLVWMLELLREFKSPQEVAFGAVLLVFVLFMPEGSSRSSGACSRAGTSRSICPRRRAKRKPQPASLRVLGAGQ